MNGPHLFARTHLLALAALLLLPACSPRKAIPSDPPDVRTKAMVRGVAAKAAQPAQAPEAAKPVEAAPPVAEAKPAEQAKADVVVAHIKAEEPNPVEASPSETKPVDKAAAAPTVVKAAAAPDVKAVETKAAAVQAVAVKPAPKTVVLKDSETALEVDAALSKAAAKQTEIETAKPEAVAKKATETAKEVERPAIVQIASFSTEKNAEAALSWLKEKGYSEARVVRVEQGQAVYHRVQAGPFQDPAAARKALEELKADWPQAFIPAD